MRGIYGLLISNETYTNRFSIKQNVSYTVIHKQMDLDGVHYTSVLEETTIVRIGTTVTPPVQSYEGFISPPTQTVVIDSYDSNIITYYYDREEYTLTINNSANVTTTTPSGRYYYGKTINLEANEFDGSGNYFIKWSNDVATRNYTFTMTSDVTIGPVYAVAHTVTFEPNNGDDQTSRVVMENQTVGTLPTVTYDDCVLSTGNTYYDRQCTYAYQFEGWFTEPTFDNQVNEDYVPIGNVTLYAKWTKVFYGNLGAQETFDGTNYIDTGIQLFSEENTGKDFIVTFTVDQNVGFSNTNGGDRGTIFADMREGSEPFPGVHFFYQSNKYTMNVNTQGHKVKDSNTGYTLGQRVVIKKINGLVYYSYDGGPDVQINDFSNFTTYFNNNATFGAGTKNDNTIYRYFKGQLSDLSVELFDVNSYTIHFDANGGTGMMVDQNVLKGASATLRENAFINSDDKFAGWNTAADGSGTTYNNKQSVTDLAAPGGVITLYAQWLETIHYTIHFDANSGSGTMNDLTLSVDDNPQPLTQNAFTKTGYMFVGWNTAADGSGTTYKDEEEVQNLTSLPNDVITLYAQWMRVLYSNAGLYEFDGTVNTFIDTGVNLYDQTNLNKDFEIRFTVNEIGATNDYANQATILSVKDESNPKWPGFNLRFPTSGNSPIQVNYKWRGSTGNSSTATTIAANKIPAQIIIRRKNKQVSVQYIDKNGNDSGIIDMYNQNSWALDNYFADNVSFGGIYNSSHNPDRFFTGKVSDMLILIGD